RREALSLCGHLPQSARAFPTTVSHQEQEPTFQRFCCSSLCAIVLAAPVSCIAQLKSNQRPIQPLNKRATSSANYHRAALRTNESQPDTHTHLRASFQVPAPHTMRGTLNLDSVYKIKSI